MLRKDRLLLIILIFLLANAVWFRTGNVWLNPALHTGVLTDEGRVNDIGRNIAETGSFTISQHTNGTGKSFGGGDVFWTGPLTPYALSLSFAIFGPGYAQERLLSMIFSMVSVFLVFLIGKRLYDKNTGILSALVFALHPMVVFYSRVALHDVLSYLLILASIYLVISVDETKRRRPCIFMIGLFAGMSVLVKYTGAMIIAVIVIYMILKRRNRILEEIPVMMLALALVGGLFLAWLYSNGPIFSGAFFHNLYVNGVASGMSGQHGFSAEFILGTINTLIFYYPFTLLFCAVGVALWKLRGLEFYARKKDAILYIWLVLGMLWWFQSLSTGKYSLAFGIPLFIITSRIITVSYKKYKTPTLLLLVLMMSFYVAMGHNIVSDFSSDAVYRMSDRMNLLESKVIFAEPELAFLSGRSMIPNYWLNSTERRFDVSKFMEYYESGIEINETLYEYMERTQPIYVILSDITKDSGHTPRKEMRYYVRMHGTFIERIGPYRLYSLDWGRANKDLLSLNEGENEDPKWDIISWFKNIIKSR